MAVAVVNRIRAPSREALEAVVARFRGRAGLVDRMPGFEGIELLVDWEGLEVLVVTRWRSREDFERWASSREFREAHSRLEAAVEGLESEGRIYEIIPV